MEAVRCAYKKNKWSHENIGERARQQRCACLSLGTFVCLLNTHSIRHLNFRAGTVGRWCEKYVRRRISSSLEKFHFSSDFQKKNEEKKLELLGKPKWMDFLHELSKIRDCHITRILSHDKFLHTTYHTLLTDWWLAGWMASTVSLSFMYSRILPNTQLSKIRCYWIFTKMIRIG